MIAGAETPEVGAAATSNSTACPWRRGCAIAAPVCASSRSGAPKQELLADALAAHCPTVGFLCVGAALDFIAGSARRAPGWMQANGLEWLWRTRQRTAPARRALPWLRAYALLLLALGVEVVPLEERR